MAAKLLANSLNSTRLISSLQLVVTSALCVLCVYVYVREPI